MDVLDDLIGRVEQDIVVETSVDPALQAAAETSLVDELTRNGAKAGIGQGALVALSPDGAVRALVGGRIAHRANSTARWRPSGSPARRSSRSSISPRSSAG